MGSFCFNVVLYARHVICGFHGLIFHLVSLLCPLFVVLFAAVWGAEFEPLLPSIPAIGTGAYHTSDSCIDPGNELCHLCYRFLPALFNASSFNLVSLVAYRLSTMFYL